MHSKPAGNRPWSRSKEMPMPFRTIVVPVDFSDESRAALDLAVQIAGESGDVHLLHAYQIIVPTLPIGGTSIPADLLEAVRTTAAEQLSQWVAEVQKSGAKVEAHLSPASPTLAIEALVEETGADLIVMGTRGLSGLKHVMLGSVAERTVRTAKCPVLTVKAPD
jgi:nucleotide-binding universal stress UspA family protein